MENNNMEKGHVELYTNGYSEGNSGPSSFAYVIRYWKINENDDNLSIIEQIASSKGFRLSTNNRMDIWAGVSGISSVLSKISAGDIKNITQINLVTKSEYFHDAITKGWLNNWKQNNWVNSKQESVKNKDLWESFLHLQEKLRDLNITLNIIRHFGDTINEFMEVVNQLCITAEKDAQNHSTDEVYEQVINNKN